MNLLSYHSLCQSLHLDWKYYNADLQNLYYYAQIPSCGRQMQILPWTLCFYAYVCLVFMCVSLCVCVCVCALVEWQEVLYWQSLICVIMQWIIFCVEEIEKLKDQLSNKDRHIAKLMKERGPVKEIGVQLDYIVLSMGKRCITLYNGFRLHIQIIWVVFT